MNKKSGFIEHFYNYVEEYDWLDGLDLYQSNKVSNVSIYHGLVSAKVLSVSRGTLEVRIKIHPGGKVIQWIECTCRANRTKGIYCDHIVAAVIHVDRENPEFFSTLDSNAPIKPPFGIKRKVKEKASTPSKNGKTESASASIVEHMVTSIHSASLVGKGPKLKVRVEIKQGTITQYELDLDAAAKFVKNPKNKNVLTAAVSKLKCHDNTMQLGTALYYSDENTVIAVRCLVLEHSRTFPSNKLEGLKTPFHTANMVKMATDGKKNRAKSMSFFPVSKIGKNIGKDFCFVPGIGYFNLERAIDPISWKDLPLSKNFVDDKIAVLLEDKFEPYYSSGPVFLDQELSKSEVVEAPKLSEVKVVSQRDGWFQLDPKYGKGDSELSMLLMKRIASNEGRKYVKSGNSWVKIPDFIAEMEWDVDDNSQTINVNAIGLMRLRAQMGEFDGFTGKQEILEAIKKSLVFDEDEPLPDISHSKLNLRSYQQVGAKWAWWLYKNHLHGLLADEMGLGKTHQAMAIMSAIQSEVNNDSCFLIICPTSVLDHWVDKLEDFAPNLRPLKYHGLTRKTKATPENFQGRAIITSYGILLRDIKLLKEVNWSAVVLDEAHFVKNNTTATYKAVCQLPSRFRFCLTGTPLENHLSELKSLYDFLIPGYLGSDDYFRREFILPIEQEETTEKELNLQKIIHPFKMRRTKSEVLTDLPAKIEDIRHCGLSKDQVGLYKEVLEMKARPLVKSLEQEDSKVSYLHVFATLQLLKQICNHPALAIKEPQNYKNYESGKFELLKELLSEALDSNNKVVIYTQYVDMIAIIKNYLDDSGIECVTLSGQTRNRGRVIDKFQTDPNVKVFIGSLLAGGVGIDLTAASVVVHYDRWWNPSKENQATDRVHRIGQKSFVQVMKLVTRGTLEEKIDRIISSKADMIEKFVDKDEEIFKKLSRQDLIGLLT